MFRRYLVILSIETLISLKKRKGVERLCAIIKEARKYWRWYAERDVGRGGTWNYPDSYRLKC